MHLPPGRYKHFKGNYYQVIGVAKHSETEEPLVVYRSEKDNSLWVRPLAMFTEQVEVNNQLISRFTYLGQDNLSEGI
ncbi:DUF1653 domain-containing protein [Desulforamulus ferrireducens]|uniref:DUF1653 domain-containing protein n=1 Tax=Desulforamulus ferrireducens TaxID=1833852 RepID=A0A1S6IV38_9FIRM|nr:DUF1653 domain-containing protein [Desulforamulus ferrireducens]AQS58644.1 hypothetical protein B0537_05820 [Desulforamulus ferrireducens]